MSKPNKYFDFLLVSVFGFYIITGVCHHFAEGSVIYLNNVLAAILLILGVILKVSNKEKGKFVVLLLLVLSTFGIINFVVATVARVGTPVSDSFAFIQYPGIDPITLLILIIYCIVNRNFFFECYSLLFHGSKQYQRSESDKKVEFYYKKFVESTNDELVGFYKMYNEYPVEAQVALKQIHEERNLNILSF
ncbi:MAG: hypothetical protein JWR50_3239 [Mucilaginibacter sp.]|nr:hypothetical protein [Mucilaginibacter sp.]